MPDDAEALRVLQAARGGHEELVRAADQQVTCGRVAAALRAHVRVVRQLLLLLGPDGPPQGWGGGERIVKEQQPFLFLNLQKI